MPETTRLREYNVTGNVVAANTPRPDAGQRISDDFTVTVSHVLDDGIHYLVFSLGTIAIHELNEPAKLVFEQEQAATILNNIYDQNEVTTEVHGQIYRVADPVPEQLEIDIPITVTTISTSQNDSDGIILTAGENEQEGARLEFSPQQTRDFKAVLKQFVSGTIADPNIGMNPLHVDETGTFNDLNT